MAEIFHLLQVVGARPQIIKSAAIDRAVRNLYSDSIELTSVHSGQHYDHAMSEVFYREMEISAPNINLNIGSGSHAVQTAAMMRECEKTFESQSPDGVLVYGDTNSTLAAAITAYKMQIPVFHVEAGLRSFNLNMPEECNRIGTDHLSTLLFCPTPAAIECLRAEGVQISENKPSLERPGIIMSGDVMYDNSLYYASQEKDNPILQDIVLGENEFILATCHRPVNTDDEEIFRGILQTLADISEKIAPVIFPVHPRLKKHATIFKDFESVNTLRLIKPVSFLEMSRLESRCKLILTDSGGIQKESFFFKKPCVVMREQTEWTELVENGNALLCGNDPKKISAGVDLMLNRNMDFPSFYGDGRSAEHILDSILSFARC